MTEEHLDERAVATFAWQGTKLFVWWAVPFSCLISYFATTLMGLSASTVGLSVLVALPPLFVLFALLYPYVLLRWMGGAALGHRPTDGPGDRLRRILKLPWRYTSLLIGGAGTMGGLAFSAAVGAWFQVPPERIALGTMLIVCLVVVLFFPISLGLERLLLPFALAEKQKYPTHAITDGGPFWPRQIWLMPLTFAVSIFTTLLQAFVVFGVELYELRRDLRQALQAGDTLKALELLDVLGSGLSSRLILTLACVAVLLPACAALAAWMLARRQAQGAQSIRETIEGLAIGKVEAPRWLSTDELGDLSSGLYAVLEKLRNLPRVLQESATRLVDAGDSLAEANNEQQVSLTRQATSLQQAHITAEELKQVTLMAAQRAESVLKVAQRAEELGRGGEAAIEQSMTGLSAIQEYVESIRQQLLRLQESASQIGNVATTVKDLADRSNMLALNAAIEAVRSGEHGKGFAVVAKEIRVLANRSITSTSRIRDMLDEVSNAISDVSAIGERGAQQLAHDLVRIKASSDNLRELTHISRETGAAIQQIVYAVNQQNTGFKQMFTALVDLSELMKDTIKRLESTQEAAGTLKVVSGEVSQVARQFIIS